MMRGVSYGRWTDNICLGLQAEYRFPIISLFSGTVFGSMGQVMPYFERFKFENFKYAGGVGLRIALNQAAKMNLRLDFTFSENGFFPISNVLEPF
jgi:hypothetical protein